MIFVTFQRFKKFSMFKRFIQIRINPIKRSHLPPLGELKGAPPNPKQLGFINVQSLSVTSVIHHLCLQLFPAMKNEDKRFCYFRLYPDFHNGF